MKFHVSGPNLHGFTADTNDIAFILMNSDGDKACILELDVGEKYVDSDGDTWERTE